MILFERYLVFNNDGVFQGSWDTKQQAFAMAKAVAAHCGYADVQQILIDDCPGNCIKTCRVHTDGRVEKLWEMEEEE